MSQEHPAVAFVIEKLRDDYFVAILIDDTGHEFIRMNTCACADQAASTASHGGTRPLEYRGMFRTRMGEREAIDDRSCNVNPRGSVWQYHGWTHGMLKRMERISA